MTRLWLRSLALCAFFCAVNLHAQSSQHIRVLESEGFLDTHPDVKFRKQAIELLDSRQIGQAIVRLKMAARYADKPSQAMLGELHWKGNGVAPDHALAYAWMDIAAERGYPLLVAKREEYWNQMDGAEQDRALKLGQALLAEYGDRVAKRRMERRLQAFRREVTGSRTGFVGPLQVVMRSEQTSTPVDGSFYYRRRYMQPDRYFAWTDSVWESAQMGSVEIGTITIPGSGRRGLTD